jgi:hypothetical protein
MANAHRYRTPCMEAEIYRTVMLCSSSARAAVLSHARDYRSIVLHSLKLDVAPNNPKIMVCNFSL